MAIVKQNHVLEVAKFIFDDAGEVVDIELTVNYELFDDVEGELETRVRKIDSVWADLNIGEQTSLNQHGKKLKVLAEAF